MTKSLAFVYEESCAFFRPDHYDTTVYHFFFDALRRSPELGVTYFPYRSTFDCSKLGKNFDFLLCCLDPHNIDSILLNNESLPIPIVTRVGDPHHALLYDELRLNRKVYCFNFYPPGHFYRYYPKSMPYEMIVHGLEPNLYMHVLPFKERIRDLILNSGAVNSTSVYGRLKVACRRLRDHDYGRLTSTDFYRLRTMCNRLPYVHYSNPNLNRWHIGDDYPRLLEKYRAAIAATTTNPNVKYLETPAAGCLTFMEVTPRNEAAIYGFRDKETAIFIDENNYRDRFEEYLSDPDNSQWEQIANSGRKYVLENLTNDIAVSHLVEWLDRI